MSISNIAELDKQIQEFVEKHFNLEIIPTADSVLIGVSNDGSSLPIEIQYKIINECMIDLKGRLEDHPVLFFSGVRNLRAFSETLSEEMREYANILLSENFATQLAE